VGAPKVHSHFETFLAGRLPNFVTAKDPSLEAINPIRILYGISRFWGTLNDVDYFQPILTNDGFIQKLFTNKVNEYLKVITVKFFLFINTE
jgi:hypothetical protein